MKRTGPQTTYLASLPQQQRDQLLLKACLDGNLKRLDLLLRSGANIDARDEDGNTPLLLVIRNQHRHCLPLLFENGASPNDKSPRHLFGGKSAFDIAMDLDDIATADILFRHGVDNPQSIARYSQLLLGLRGDLPPTQKTSATTNSTSHSNNMPLEGVQFRTWTDQSTSFTIEAEFLSLNQGQVTLRGRNDRQVIIPIAKISRKDLEYIGGVLGVALEIDCSHDTRSLPTNKDATASSGENISTSTQFEQAPGYDHWFLFFCTCDIPITRSESYAQKFVTKSIDQSILPLADAQFWGSQELLYEDVIKIMSFLDDTYRAQAPQPSVRNTAGKDSDTMRRQHRTRGEQYSPQVVQQKPLRPAIKLGPSASRRESERGRSQSAPPSRQPMDFPFPIPKLRGESPLGEFEQEFNTRGRPYRRATWEDNDRGRRSRANSWDELDIMARSRSRSCSLPARYAGQRVSQERNMRTRSRSVRIRSRSRSNWGGEDIEIEIDRIDWDDGDVDIEITRSGGGRRGLWRRERGEYLGDFDPYLLEHYGKSVYSRGRYYAEGRVLYRGRR
ncbi:hypothetical protein N431DRAFT_472806 [Stipitochalara longipes BDJ]|nr:hypothetical protein N431DRAFT_472806 [Stipitochalara longipes BDJ]